MAAVYSGSVRPSGRPVTPGGPLGAVSVASGSGESPNGESELVGGLGNHRMTALTTARARMSRTFTINPFIPLEASRTRHIRGAVLVHL